MVLLCFTNSILKLKYILKWGEGIILKAWINISDYKKIKICFELL